MSIDLEKMMANLILNIDRLEESQANSNARIAETDARLEKMFAKTDARLEKMFAETNAGFAEIKALQAENAAEIRQLGIRNKELSTMYGGVSEHLGDEADLDFFIALQNDPILADIHFDDVDFDITRKKGKSKVQLDLFLTNGDNIAIVEVKRHLQSSHIDHLHNHTIPVFRKLYPEYQDKNLYAALATYGIPKKAKQYVEKRLEKYGYGLLTPNKDGTRILVDDHAMRIITVV